MSSREERRIEAQRLIMMRQQSAQERAAAQMIRRHFARQLREIFAALEEGQKASDSWWSRVLGLAAMGLPDEDAETAIRDALGELIDWDAERVRLEQIIKPVLQRGFEAGKETAETAFGLNAVQQPALTRHLMERGMERVAEIEDTTKKVLARSIAEGVQAGESRKQLAQRVKDHMPGVQSGRAETIAMNEAHISLQSGSFELMRAAGVREKIWDAIGDGNTRESHKEIDGQRRPIDEPFSNGLMYPGDPEGELAETINCRCTLRAGKVSAIRAAMEELRREEAAPLSPTYVNPKANASSALLFKNAKNIKPISGFEDVIIHGTPDSFIIEGNQGEDIRYTAEKLADRLRKEPGYHGGAIRLMSCETGKNETGIAQWLADEMGVEVMAPTHLLWVMSDGSLAIGDEPLSNDGKWVIFKPRSRYYR